MDRTTLTLYCVKTGQAVGTTLEPYTEPPSICAPKWKQTDGTNLDRVQEHEPRAYVAYCLGRIDVFWRRKMHREGKAAFMSRQDAIEHHWSLVRAYELLEQVSEYDLKSLADALCRFCCYAPLSYRILDGGNDGKGFLPARRTADLLAEAAIGSKLLGAIEKACVKTLVDAERFATNGASVRMAKFEIHPTSIEDAAKGPSNIRDQKNARKLQTREYAKQTRQNLAMSALYKQFGPELRAMFGNKQPKPKTEVSKLLGRLSAQQSPDANMIYKAADDKELDMWQELQRRMAGGTSFSLNQDEDEDEDDTVEVRTIPRAAVESLRQVVQPQTEGQGKEESPKIAQSAKFSFAKSWSK